jgi:thiol-disulfide isomerase/thioredoxin
VSAEPQAPRDVQPIDPSARWKTFAIFVIVAVVAVFILLDRTLFEGQNWKARTAPEEVYQDHDGKPVRLSNYRGKIVLVNFWATWCPPCRQETPSFDRLAAKLKATHPDIAILAVSVDEDGWQAIDPFLNAMHAHNLPVVLGDTNLAARFGTYKLPETWVVGRDGRILDRMISVQNWDDPRLPDELEKLDRSPAS